MNLTNQLWVGRGVAFFGIVLLVIAIVIPMPAIANTLVSGLGGALMITGLGYASVANKELAKKKRYNRRVATM